MASSFKYRPAACVPFRDTKAIDRCRKITRQQIEKHRNPDYRIRVVKDSDLGYIWITDMFQRIHAAAQSGQKLVMILPNPCPDYRHVARLINACKIDCRNLFAFAMDEYADENGRIAPENWAPGFTYSMKNYFLYQIDPALRPPEKQFVGFTNRNIKDYGKMITDAGGADICYSGPGWTGHLAFIEPDAPEFAGTLEQWKKMGPRVCTLSPFTLAQNSLHGSFGYSGDLAAVPPKAATIGPAQVIESKHRLDFHSITVHGTATSWQRLMTRLCLHGPVTPKLPTSLLQTLRSDIYVSETSAADIHPDFDKGY